MTSNADRFREWALAPERTLEERCTVERLVENTRRTWRKAHGLSVAEDIGKLMERGRARKLNPAYEPVVAREDIERAADVLEEVPALGFDSTNDRPLRDVNALRFCLALKQLSISSAQVRDWAPLAALEQLEKLSITDRLAEDFRVIAQLTGLKELSLTVECPWPRVEGLEKLEQLEKFSFHGNLLVLEPIPRLAAVREANLGARFGLGGTPIRDLHRLPEMPELRALQLFSTYQLAGIERYPLLRNLEVAGWLDHLTPLTALGQLTFLTLSGGHYESLAPLTALKELRQLEVRREEPQDYAPLVELPHLHSIETDRAALADVELDGLRAMLPPWSEEFALLEPRPLPALRLTTTSKLELNLDVNDGSFPGEPRDYSEDPKLARAEAVWFAQEVNARLNELIGPDWGECPAGLMSRGGMEMVYLTRFEDLQRIGEVVQTLRELIAAAKHPWTIFLSARSEPTEFDRAMEEDEEEAASEEWNAEREREEWEDFQRQRAEHLAFLERAHRYKISKELGTPIDPKDFAAPEEKSGEPAESAFLDPEDEDAHVLTVSCMLTLDEMRVREDEKDTAEFLLGMKAEE